MPPLCQSSSPYAAYYPMPLSDADKASYLQKWGDYFSGDVDFSTSTTESSYEYRDGGGYPFNPTIPDTNPDNTGHIPFWEFAAIQRMGGPGTGYDSVRKQSLGGEAKMNIEGSMRYKIVWQRNMIPDPANPSGPYVRDRNDNPTGKDVYVHIQGGWSATSHDGDNQYSHVQGYEGADATLSIGDISVSAQGENTPNRMLATANLDKTIKLPIGDSDEIWLPYFKVSAQCNLLGDRHSVPASTSSGSGSYSGGSVDTRTYWRWGLVSQSGSFSATPTPFYVEISSNIEPSWKKGTGALPEEYTKLDSSGKPRYASEQVAGANTPGDTSDDVWKLECIRELDGSMTVESAATPSLSTYGSTTDLFWYGGGSFSANTKGYSSPTFSWDIGTVTGASTSNPFTVVDYVQSNPFGPSSNSLGIGPHLPSKSSTVKVTVGGNTSDPTLIGTYKVNWHEPVENITQVGNPVKTYTMVPGAVVDGYPTVMGVGEQTKIVLDPKLVKGMLFLSNSEKMTVMVGTLVLTRGATVYIKGAEAGKLLTTGFLLSQFYNLEMKDAMEAPEYGTCSNTQEEWNRAVTSTRDSLNHVPGADSRISPPDIALEEPNDMRWLSSDMTAWVKRSSTTIFTKGDEYGHNGYNGVAPGQIDSDDKLEVVGYFEFTGRPPTM